MRIARPMTTGPKLRPRLQERGPVPFSKSNPRTVGPINYLRTYVRDSWTMARRYAESHGILPMAGISAPMPVASRAVGALFSAQCYPLPRSAFEAGHLASVAMT